MSENIVQTYQVITTPSAVTLTTTAAKYIQNQIIKNGKGTVLRFGVKKSGCSGFSYTIEIVDTVNADDHVFTCQDNLSVVIDPKSLPYVTGTQIDYVREGLNSSFKFNNPNEKHACGCGESFTIE